VLHGRAAAQERETDRLRIGAIFEAGTAADIRFAGEQEFFQMAGLPKCVRLISVSSKVPGRRSKAR